MSVWIVGQHFLSCVVVSYSSCPVFCFFCQNLLKEMIRNELGVDTKVIIQDTRQLLSKYVVLHNSNSAFHSSNV